MFVGLNHYTTLLVTDGNDSGGKQLQFRMSINFIRKRGRGMDAPYLSSVAWLGIVLAVFCAVGIQKAPYLHPQKIRLEQVPDLRD